MWYEMSLFQKIMFVICWICVAILLVLAVLIDNYILKFTRIIKIIFCALIGTSLLGSGIAGRSRIGRVVDFVLAGVFLLCLLALAFE